MQAIPEQKVTYLDGLRGLAAVIVVIAHYLQVFVPAMYRSGVGLSHFAFDQVIPKTPLNLLFNGDFAVCLFFVLSGYVLSYRFFRSQERSVVVAGMIKRYFRLAIPVFASLLLAYAVMKLGWSRYGEVRALTGAAMPNYYAITPGFGELIRQALFHTFFTYGNAYNPVLWTMTYELFGSFLIFAVLLCVGTSKWRFAVYPVSICLCLNSYYLGFWLGMLLSDLGNSFGISRIHIRSRIALALLVVAGVYFGSFPYVHRAGTLYAWLPPRLGYPYGATYHTLGAALLVLALLNSSTGQKALASKPLAYLGRLSFSLYLVHICVLFSFSCLLFLRLLGRTGYGPDVLATIVVSIPVVILLAHLMYRLVDAPVVQLLSRVRFRDGQRNVG